MTTKSTGILIGTIGVVVALYSFAAAAAGTTIFLDVPSTHPHARAIFDLKSRGVISGYPDGNFKPDRAINRAEALKIILLGSGIEASNIFPDMEFTDVEPSSWYAGYVKKAKALDIIEGYADKTFRPHQTVNLVESLKIILAANKIDIGGILVVEDPYRDTPKGQWYAKYIAYAKAKNLIDADVRDMVFPGQEITRAKLAEIIYRFYLQSGSTGISKPISPAPSTEAVSPASLTSSTPASSTVSTTTSTSSTLPTAAALGPLACKTANTLESLINCIIEHFGPFVIPTDAQRTDFRAVIRQMLNRQCENIVIPSSLTDIYNIRTLTDTETSKNYCLLIESGDRDNDGKVDNGWGTFIVNNQAARELNIAITHPVDDTNTEHQGINIFKGTDGRTYLLAGATRHLGGASACTGDRGYDTSDAAHNIANMFWPATQEIDAWYGPKMWTQLQFHGMAATTCPGVDIFMTYGATSIPKPDDIILKLKTNLLKYFPATSITVMGDTPACGLTATGNSEGRYLNNPDGRDYCTTFSKTYTQKFIHIEQTPSVRKNTEYGAWVKAIMATWP